MGRGVVLSVLLHALVAILAVTGLPTASRTVVPPPAVDVELAWAPDPVRAAPETPPSPAAPETEPGPPAPVAPAPPAPAVPVAEPEPESAAAPEAAALPASAVVPAPPAPVPSRPAPPAPEAPLPEPVAPAGAAPGPAAPAAPAPPPETVRTAAAPAPPPPPSRFDDMLRDLTEREPAAEAPPTKLEEALERYAALDPAPAGSETPEERFARARMYGLIQRQVQANWRRPPALREDGDLYVVLEFQLQRDGTIHDLRVSEDELRRIGRNPLLRPLLDSAQTAILKTGRISGLPPDEYARWRRVRLNFRPQR